MVHVGGRVRAATPDDFVLVLIIEGVHRERLVVLGGKIFAFHQNLHHMRMNSPGVTQAGSDHVSQPTNKFSKQKHRSIVAETIIMKPRTLDIVFHLR